MKLTFPRSEDCDGTVGSSHSHKSNRNDVCCSARFIVSCFLAGNGVSDENIGYKVLEPLAHVCKILRNNNYECKYLVYIYSQSGLTQILGKLYKIVIQNVRILINKLYRNETVKTYSYTQSFR